MAKVSHSPLLYTYLKRYQEDPTSRVFAPLAEAYRKAGLVDEAIEIAREGLKLHPGFVGGKVALARALFDKKQFEEVIQTLGSIIQDVPDNLIAQRLLAESCLMLGRVAEALGAYKMLLYFSPHDGEIAKIVQELEAQAYEKGTLVLRSDTEDSSSNSGDPSDSFDIRPVGSVLAGDPELKRLEWVKRVEILQGLLQKVERYKTRHHDPL